MTSVASMCSSHPKSIQHHKLVIGRSCENKYIGQLCVLEQILRERDCRIIYEQRNRQVYDNTSGEHLVVRAGRFERKNEIRFCPEVGYMCAVIS
jgi:hypothetical protein